MADGNGAGPVCNDRGVLLRPPGPVVRNFAHIFGRRGGLAARLALIVGVLVGCAETPIRTAPFRVRPDAADAGSLRGPFTGRVIDQTTHAPIAGALIYAAWTLERGTGLLEPAGAREFVGSTDAAGNYRVPPIVAPPPGARVTELVILIY